MKFLHPLDDYGRARADAQPWPKPRLISHRSLGLDLPNIGAGMAVRLRRRHQHHQHADQIERGCARIEKRLNALGAKVTRVPARERSFSACSPGERSETRDRPAYRRAGVTQAKKYRSTR
jgi:hypothetical protein